MRRTVSQVEGIWTRRRRSARGEAAALAAAVRAVDVGGLLCLVECAVAGPGAAGVVPVRVVPAGTNGVLVAKAAHGARVLDLLDARGVAIPHPVARAPHWAPQFQPAPYLLACAGRQTADAFLAAVRRGDPGTLGVVQSCLSESRPDLLSGPWETEGLGKPSFARTAGEGRAGRRGSRGSAAPPPRWQLVLLLVLLLFPAPSLTDLHAPCRHRSRTQKNRDCRHGRGHLAGRPGQQVGREGPDGRRGRQEGGARPPRDGRGGCGRGAASGAGGGARPPAVAR